MTQRLVEPRVEQAPPLVYRVGEVARLLQISEATVYRRIRDNEIPSVGVPGSRIRRVPAWWVEEATRAA